MSLSPKAFPASSAVSGPFGLLRTLLPVRKLRSAGCRVALAALLVPFLPALHAQDQKNQNGTQSSAQTQDNLGGGGATAGAQQAIPQAATSQSGAPVSIHSSDDSEDSSRRTSAAATQRPAALPPARLSDFELFVRDTIGYTLPVFGRDLFQNATSTFQSPNVPPPSDYVLGPGDEVRVRATGKVDIDVRTRVSASGEIYVPQVGPILVAGTRADAVTDVVRRAVSRQFKGFELTVTLGQLRSIQIFVLGQARKPGNYTVSSLSTLVNALFDSGGPSPSGSLRDIQLIRNGETITHFDVYRLLLSGDKTADRHLLAGDILYIPPVGPQVAVAGDVSTPGIFELAGTSSTVADALTYAAGLTPVAGVSRAVLDRVVEHAHRSVLNFPLDAAGRATVLQGGDILRVQPISPRIEDAVTLRGPLSNPGRYAWRAGQRISDLIPTRESLLTRDFFNQRNALDLPMISARTATDAPAAQAAATQPATAATQPATAATQPATAVNPQAETQSGQFTALTGTLADTRTAATPVTQHETDINWAYATIERINPQSLKVSLLSFNLGEAIDQPSSPENKLLQPGDVVTVYNSRDIQLPLELTTKLVRIDGQVNAPGIYQVTGNETLRDLVRRAGGLAPHAYLYAAQLTRESVRIEQQARLKQLLDRETLSALAPSNIVASTTSGADASAGQLQLRRAYLAELAKVAATGRVVLQLTPESHALDDVPELALQDADHLFIPSLPNTVNVVGSVYNQGSFRYVDHGRVKRYLNAAGGPDREADKGREFIVRADGTLVSRNRIGNFDRQVLYPGDSVVIPGNFKNRRAPIDFLATTSALSSLALSAVAIGAVSK